MYILNAFSCLNPFEIRASLKLTTLAKILEDEMS